VADNDRLFNVQMNERLAQQYRVIAVDRPGFGHTNRPRSRIWTPAAQAEVVHKALDHPANLKILHHDAVTVQQDKGWPLASLQVMEADSLDIEEVTGRRVVPLRLTCASSVHQSRGSQDGGRG
jgi:hypothetical protein